MSCGWTTKPITDMQASYSHFTFTPHSFRTTPCIVPLEIRAVPLGTHKHTFEGFTSVMQSNKVLYHIQLNIKSLILPCTNVDHRHDQQSVPYTIIFCSQLKIGQSVEGTLKTRYSKGLLGTFLLQGTTKNGGDVRNKTGHPLSQSPSVPLVLPILIVSVGTGNLQNGS